MRLGSPVVLAAAVLATAAPADAEETRRPSLPRTLLVEPSLGFKAPLGWAGLSVDVVPTRPLVLHAGAGIGFRGLQVSAGARGRVPVGSRAFFGLGLAWSATRYAGADTGVVVVPFTWERDPGIWWWSPAHFASGEVTIEYDAKIFVVRPFTGLSFLVDAGDGVRANASCVATCDGRPGLRARLFPYSGLAFAFGVL